MSDYTPNDIVDVLLCLGEAKGNYLEAMRTFQRRFPHRRCPSNVTIQFLEERARQGLLKRQRKKKVIDDNDPEGRSIVVLALIHINPHISLRDIENTTGTPRSTAQRILKSMDYHPYHICLVQSLTTEDFLIRLNFCTWAQRRIEEDSTFFHHVLFSDEATFHNVGILNRHNCHYWCAQNPHWVRTVDQHRWSVNVWCGIVDSRIIGPYFFEGNLTGAEYLRFLQLELPALMEDISLDVRSTMWFQQDGAPPHYMRIVRNFLDEKFPGRWIGRGGTVRWPPRSPDLTSPDFFLWGYIKNVFREPPTTRDDMKDRIRRACVAITPAVLRLQHSKQATVESFHKRIALCQRQNGGNFEHLLNA